MIARVERVNNIKRFNWYRDNIIISFMWVSYAKYFLGWVASCGGIILGHMGAVMFLGSNMPEAVSSTSNNDIWDDTNILKYKHNLNRSLKEPSCELDKGFKIDKEEEKSTAVSNLPSD